MKAYENNYLHLLGVHTTLNPKEFFCKCLDGTLNDEDFDFNFFGKNENEVKGTVRRKINSLKHLESFFENITGIEEKFGKGNVSCAIAGSDDAITIGYANSKSCVPMTLLKGNELSDKRIPCDLLLSKSANSEKFDSIIIGDKDILHSIIKSIEIQFEIRKEVPNATTLSAIAEAEEMEKHPELYKTYTSINGLLNDLTK